jgi:peptide/nickel transport system substrate-binding protein
MSEKEVHTMGKKDSLNRREFFKKGARIGAGLSAGWALARYGLGKGSLAEGAEKGSLTISQGVDVESMDPHITRSTMGRSVLKTVFDSLLDIDSHLKEYSELATSWKNEDPNTWVFTLREGVRFHNGEKFDATTVKYSIERIVDPKMKSFFAQFMNVVKDVEIVNPHRVKIITKQPYAPMIEVLRDIDMVPKAAETMGPQEFAKKPIGTGPYRFVEWVPNERVVVAANEEYYLGAPKLRKVIWRPIPELSTRIVELNTGGADIITGLSPLDVGRLKKDVCRAEGILSVYAIWYLLNCFNPAIADVRVRQALNYAVNKEEIIKVFLQGEAAPLSGCLTPYHEGYNPALKPYPYDPARAKKLLQEAGYGKGFELSLKYTRGRWTKSEEVSLAVAGYLSEIGIKVKTEAEEYGQHLQSLFSRGKAGDLLDFSSSALSTFRMYPPLFPSNTPGVAWHGWKNLKFDQLFDQARVEMDTAKRKALLQETATILRDDPPCLFIHQQKDIFGVSNRVREWVARPDAHVTIEKTFMAD